MHVVALCELYGSAEAEAAPLASIFGVGPYDVRQWLSGGLPRVVLQTADPSTAVDVVRRLRARGHGAMTCDLADVVPGTGMVKVHRFAFDDAAFWANDAEGDFLPWESVGAILVVARRVEVVRSTRQRQLGSSPTGRPPPSVVVMDRTHEHLVEHMAYLFARDRSMQPWLLHEQEAQYLSLGPRMKLTRYENFRETLALLRARAPGAIYDERYATQPRTAAQLVQVRGHDAPVAALSDLNIDALVHVLAEWLLRGRGGPYRDAGRT